MSNYYVSGCVADGDDVSICDDSVAQFWTLYHRNEEGLSESIIDCMFREDAETAMRAYEERDALAADEGYKQAFYEIADILGIGARPDSPKDVFEKVIKPMLINLKKERSQLATENAALLIRLRNIIDIVSKADNRYCMCGESMDSHSLGGCGSPIGTLDYHFGKLTDKNPETPATDDYLNTVRAGVIKQLHSEQKEWALVTWQYDSFDALKRAAVRHGDSELSGVIFMLDRIEGFAAQLRAGKDGE
ncbi:hypothetical protein [Pantoea agglomerans]|uniref:hypothetical protein n=1 Tax=Enterobacter agglomerans TaxID=549 RepID=UPI003C7A3C88